jgi:hypothetical protein
VAFALHMLLVLAFAGAFGAEFLFAAMLADARILMGANLVAAGVVVLPRGFGIGGAAEGQQA